MHLTSAQPITIPSEDLGLAEAVRLGWRLVDIHERLGPRLAREVFSAEIEACFADARAGLADLSPWPGIEGVMAAYQDDVNRSRFRRILDFVQPGARIFDVGSGPGYLAALLDRDADIDAYRGIDLNPRLVESFDAMRRLRGLDPACFTNRLGDLFELEAAELAEVDADLVICCEVLEHVADPERALERLAAILPPGADLLFSVPMLGRLEAVWGHLTVFDTARLRTMCARAGLTVHHVEPHANTWALVVASRDRRPSARVRLARPRPGVDLTPPLTAGARDFVFVPRAALTPARGGQHAASSLDKSRKPTPCRIDASPESAPGQEHIGGVGFDVAGFSAGRLALTAVDAAALARIEVVVLAGAYPLARWEWRPSRRWCDGEQTRRVAFRPGERNALFSPVGVHRQGPADRFEVRGVVAAGTSATFAISAAYLPGPRP